MHKDKSSGVGGGGGVTHPPPTPDFAGHRGSLQGKMWNLTCENENTIIAKYYFVTDDRLTQKTTTVYLLKKTCAFLGADMTSA